MKKVVISPMIADIIKSGMANIDGFLFDATKDCPFCGGYLKGHDIKRKKFVTILENNCRKNIYLNVKRHRCTDCKKLVYSDSPFYDNIRMGSPIVDFCLINLKIHPANHVSKILEKLNILVSPATIRSISVLDHGDIPSFDFHRILFPLSLLNISENILKNKGTGVNHLVIQMMQKRQ